MDKVSQRRDTHTRRCPGCGEAFAVRPDKWDCACPWWCRTCLASMKRRAA